MENAENEEILYRRALPCMRWSVVACACQARNERILHPHALHSEKYADEINEYR